jgi:hypothetical protein
MQPIDICYTIAKNLPKTPRQKPAKNPMQTKICSDHAKIFCEKINIKILNNTKNFLILPNKTKNPSMNFELITAKYDCRCSLTGKNFTRGDQVYYNYEAKTFLDPVYHENIISQQKSRGAQSYFERHKKLNKIYPNT